MVSTGRLVRGSITVSVLALVLSTYNWFRSHDGVMWWGTLPTGKWVITRRLIGSMTSTVPSLLFGTYTRAGMPDTPRRRYGSVPDAQTLAALTGRPGVMM